MGDAWKSIGTNDHTLRMGPIKIDIWRWTNDRPWQYKIAVLYVGTIAHRPLGRRVTIEQAKARTVRMVERWRDSIRIKEPRRG